MARAGQENRNIKAWLSSAQPLAVEGGHTLIIGFELPFLREKLEGERSLAERALQEATGQPLRIRCVLSRDYQPTAVVEQPATQKKSFRDEVEAFAHDYGGIVSDSQSD